MVLFHSSGALPECRGLLKASSFLIEVAKVRLHCRIGSDLLGGAAQILFRQIVVTQAEVDPAERIEIAAVL